MGDLLKEGHSDDVLAGLTEISSAYLREESRGDDSYRGAVLTSLQALAGQLAKGYFPAVEGEVGGLDNYTATYVYGLLDGAHKMCFASNVGELTYINSPGYLKRNSELATRGVALVRVFICTDGSGSQEAALSTYRKSAGKAHAEAGALLSVVVHEKDLVPLATRDLLFVDGKYLAERLLLGNGELSSGVFLTARPNHAKSATQFFRAVLNQASVDDWEAVAGVAGGASCFESKKAKMFIFPPTNGELEKFNLTELFAREARVLSQNKAGLSGESTDSDQPPAIPVEGDVMAQRLDSWREQRDLALRYSVCLLGAIE